MTDVLRPLATAASSSQAGAVLQEYVQPITRTLCTLAALASIVFLIIGGLHYMTSAGNPERMERAKQILKNAAIGLVVVIAATALTAILAHAYHSPPSTGLTTVPSLGVVQPDKTGFSIVNVLVKAVTGFLNNIIQSVATPIMKVLNNFTSATPLVATNQAVFTLWATILAVADALFVLVVGILGFHIMSASSLGMDEVDLKQMLPQLVGVFVLMNSSIFIIDGVISFSNALIHALQVGLNEQSVWQVLTGVVKQAGGYGVAALLMMVAFLILSVVLLVYYVLRIVTLYIGAVLAPLVLLLWILPGFKDFAVSALKTYVSTIFVLFIHVVILELAASLFAGMYTGPNKSPDPLMAMIVGLAALVALLKTQGFMMQLSYANQGARSMRRLGSQFINGASFVASQGRSVGSIVAQGGPPRLLTQHVSLGASNANHALFSGSSLSATPGKTSNKPTHIAVRHTPRHDSPTTANETSKVKTGKTTAVPLLTPIKDKKS